MYELFSTHFFSFCLIPQQLSFFFFFFNDTATTEIYTLSLHDALPICDSNRDRCKPGRHDRQPARRVHPCGVIGPGDHPIPDESDCALSKPACDVVFRPFVGRSGENLFRLIKFYQLAKKEKSGELSNTRRLLHVMSDDDDGEVFFELKN